MAFAKRPRTTRGDFHTGGGSFVSTKYRAIQAMAETVITRQGEELLNLLRTKCAFSTKAARDFIESRTGFTFDPQALYSIRADSSLESWHQGREVVVWRTADKPSPPA